MASAGLLRAPSLGLPVRLSSPCKPREAGACTPREAFKMKAAQKWPAVLISALVNRHTRTPCTEWLKLQITASQRKLHLERHAGQTQPVLRPGRDVRAGDALSCLGRDKP